MSKKKPDTDRIAGGLGDRKNGELYPTGGSPGAAKLAAEVQAAALDDDYAVFRFGKDKKLAFGIVR